MRSSHSLECCPSRTRAVAAFPLFAPCHGDRPGLHHRASPRLPDFLDGIFAHYEDGALGRAVRFEIKVGAESGAGLAAIYREGRAFEVVAIDAGGNARPDWAAAVCQRPIVVRPVSGEAAKDRDWQMMVRRLGAQLDPTRRLYAVAAIEMRPALS